jgi:hypothetical protein
MHGFRGRRLRRLLQVSENKVTGDAIKQYERPP